MLYALSTNRDDDEGTNRRREQNNLPGPVPNRIVERILAAVCTQNELPSETPPVAVVVTYCACMTQYAIWVLER